MARRPIAHLFAFLVVVAMGLGCAGEQDVCQAANEHLQSCYGTAVELEFGETCEPELAAKVLEQDCPQFDETKADGIVHSFARWAWRQVATFYMRPRGLYFAADLLEHSLQDNPGDLTPGGEVILHIINSPEYQSYVDGIPDGSYSEWSKPHEFEFRENTDLFSSLQHVRIAHRGSKHGGSQDLEIKIADYYTFHWQVVEIDNLDIFLASFGANFAYLDQLAGVIVPYDVVIEFVDAR